MLNRSQLLDNQYSSGESFRNSDDDILQIKNKDLSKFDGNHIYSQFKNDNFNKTQNNFDLSPIKRHSTLIKSIIKHKTPENLPSSQSVINESMNIL